jgi:hypothetical protein
MIELLLWDLLLWEPGDRLLWKRETVLWDVGAMEQKRSLSEKRFVALGFVVDVSKADQSQALAGESLGLK